MNEKTKEFLELIKNNPDLPIIPMVDSEVCCGNEYDYWCGSWTRSEVDEYCIFHMRGEERFFSRDEQDKIEEYLADDFSDFEEYADLSDEEFNKVVKEKIEGLNWTRAIVVWIGLPEVDNG